MDILPNWNKKTTGIETEKPPKPMD